jgi:ribosomal protein S18 acetylase RimI-like enzyme
MPLALVPGAPDEVFQRRFEESFVGGLDAVLDAMGLTREELRSRMRTTGEIRTVQVDGVSAGSVWTELRGRILHIHALVLDDTHRGRGLGARVLRLIEKEAADLADEIELGVQDTNVAAWRLYRKAGFHEVEALPVLGFHVLRKPVEPGA